MKKLLIIIVFLNCASSVNAQQDILVSQYMFNHLLLNPAYAGSKDYMMATLLYRKQWIDWKGAPETQVATIHGPLGLTNFGWGLMLSHDKISVTDRTDAYLNAAYHLTLSPNLKLSLGLRGGGGYYSIKNSDLIYWDAGDPTFAEDRVTKFLPNVGCGTYLYSDKFYAGVSVPTIISYDPSKGLSVDLSSGEVVPRQVRHYFATTGYAIVFNPDFVLTPSVLAKFVHHTPLEIDYNLNMLIGQLIMLGGSYRTGDSFVALFELQLGRQWRLGYSYDFTFTDVKDYSSGSHEIMIGYDFGYDIMKIKTPRYF
jgi:type IX secretion system PorP/SprF family membrane protein